MTFALKLSPSGPLVQGSAPGDIILWDDVAKEWYVAPASSGGGAFPAPPAGDDGFLPRAGTGPTEGELVYFGGAAGQIVVWNTTTLQWEAGAVPTGVTITSFAIVGGVVRYAVGATVATPSETAGYTGTPDAVTLSDNQGNPAVVLLSPFTAFVNPYSYSKTTIAATVLQTLTAQKAGFANATRTLTFTWCAPYYWGASASAGPYDAAFITGLSNNALTTSKSDSLVQAMSTTAGAGQYDFWSCPASYGTVTITDNSTGFQVDTTVVQASTPVVINGVTVNFQVLRSTNLLPGTLSSRSS